MRRIYLLLFCIVYLTPLWSQDSIEVFDETSTSMDLVLIEELETVDSSLVDTVLNDTNNIDTVLIDTNSIDTILIDTNSIDSIPAENEVEESDTTEVDSSIILEQQRTFLQLLKEQSQYLYTHPTHPDTLFNPYEINRIKYSRDDYFTWNEVLRSHGEFISNYS